MDSFLKSECGRQVIECEYDPALLNWNEAIEAAYRAHGFRPGQIQVICSPRPYPVTWCSS